MTSNNKSATANVYMRFLQLAKAIQIRQYFESTPDIDPSKSQKLISKYREYAKEVIKEFAKLQTKK